MNTQEPPNMSDLSRSLLLAGKNCHGQPVARVQRVAVPLFIDRTHTIAFVMFESGRREDYHSSCVLDPQTGRGRDLRWTERRQEEPQTPPDRAGLHIEVETSCENGAVVFRRARLCRSRSPHEEKEDGQFTLPSRSPAAGRTQSGS